MPTRNPIYGAHSRQVRYEGSHEPQRYTIVLHVGDSKPPEGRVQTETASVGACDIGRGHQHLPE